MGTLLLVAGVLAIAAFTPTPAGNTHLAHTQNDARML